MRATLALVRASWLVQASRPVGLLVSIAGLAGTLATVWYAATAMQPLMAGAVRDEGRDFFGFVVLGFLALSLVSAATSALPQAVAGSLGNGTFEAMLETPAPVPAVLVGLAGYPLCWALARGALLVGAGVAIGMPFSPAAFLPGLGVVLLLVVAYGAVGLLAAALVLEVRTPGPIPAAAVTLSALLGGVWFPTHVIPDWIERVSAFVPLAPGLRALRRLWLQGVPIGAVADDVLLLGVFAVTLSATGTLAFHRALDRARRRGTLGIG